MSHKRLTRPVVTLLAVTSSAVLLTGGIAEAEGGGHSAGHGACAATKKAPVTGRTVSVSGHSVRVLLPNSHRSTGAAAQKQKAAPGGAGGVSVNGHTVRAVSTGGHRATRPC